MSGDGNPPVERATDGVAVIGMALRFPGADSVGQFWENLCRGVESIERFSAEEMLAAGVDPALIADPNYVPARGLFRDPEAFDAPFFGISVREAELMDPQHRVFLESCWAALENGGYAPSRVNGSVGVWGGMSTGMTNNTYLLSNLHGRGSRRLAPEDSLPAMLGNENDYLTTRVSYKLNLSGPSVNVQTACSTSLVAITQAYQNLMLYGCDMALAGGVSVSYPQQDGYLFQEGGIGSPDGHCRPFDARAQGTVFSNGVGVVLLKRLEDALEDRDTIYAVIRGAALNNDGADKMSFAAPSVTGQAEAIASAQAVADVDAATVSYVECHGTATPIGDPIEVAALTEAFRGGGAPSAGNCALGSVKSNFGHLDSAAGVAAFIKTVLCLHHRMLVPTLHYERPNPQIDFADSPFYVADRLTPWEPACGVRRAGVSGFGIGGTNAHLVLEEAPPAPVAGTTTSAPQLLPISAKSRTAFAENARRLAGELGADPKHRLADVAHTLQIGRESFRYRGAVVAASCAQAAQQLTALAERAGQVPATPAAAAEVALLFAGGGSQYLSMAAGLMARFPSFAADIEAGLAAFERRSDLPLRGTWFAPAAAGDAVRAFERPALQLPALFIVEVALARFWIAAGVKPTALLGHSMGENSAACVAGIMRYEDALGLVALRGRLFEQVAAGVMLSVAISPDQATAIAGTDVDLATINGPEQCTLSGSEAAITALEARLDAAEIDYQRIPIAIAAHSRLLDGILPAFRDYLQGIELSTPQIPLVSNLSGTWLTDAQATDPEYWVSHLRSTVRFAEGLATLDEAAEVLLECGPGRTLGSLARLQLRDGPRRVLSSLRHGAEASDDDAVLLQTAGRLWESGVALDLEVLHDRSDLRRVALPSYAFDRHRYLIEPERPPGEIAGAAIAADAADTAPSPVAHNKVAAAPAAADPVQAVVSQAVSEAPIMLTRLSLLTHRLTRIFHDLSGVPESEIDASESFLDMGFDSLFLTQANLRIKKAFKVKITFRQLFDDAPTIDALARYIDEKLPPEALREELEAAAPAPAPATGPKPAPAVTAAASAAAPAASSIPQAPATVGAGDGSLLQQATLLQMQASNALLLALGQQGLQGVAPAAAPASAAPEPEPAAAAEEPVVREHRTEVARPVAGDSSGAVAARALGPYKPVDQSPSSYALSDTARKALQQFTDDYSARTAASKALAGEQRAYLSDARSISGFRKEWKEIVYQLAAGKGSKGSRVYDLDGNEYVDVTSGFGINLFGYSPDWAVEAAHAQIEDGIELGTLSPKAAEAARLIRDLTGMERSTFTNTGSEAISAAIRAARTTTGKEMIAVFYDEYHGISDEVLVNIVRTPGGTRTVPTSPGIPQSLVDQVLVLEWNDPNCMARIRDYADELAAVIVEPVQNRNPALKTNLRFGELRAVTSEHDIALIYDEMITGFRLAPGGAQEYFDAPADMVCYGKIVGGGMPIAVVAGRGEYLDCFDGGPWQFGDDSFPEAGVTFFGGTYTRHPIALATTVAALKQIQAFGPAGYDALNARARAFAHRLNTLMATKGFPARIESRETIFNLKFNDDNPYARLVFWQLRHRGVLIYDRPFFISDAHSAADFDFIAAQFEASIDFLQRSGIVAPCSLAGEYGIEKLVPFNQAQAEVYLATELGADASRAYHEQVIYDLPGCFDVPALEHAIAKVVAKHDGLRSRVDASGEGFVVSPALAVPLGRQQLSVDGDPEAVAERCYRTLVQAPFDLGNGPLIRFTLVSHPIADGERHSLVVTAHHLLIDGWSMGIVLKDLSEIYALVLDAQRCLPSAEVQLEDYLSDELEFRGSEEFAETRAYWADTYAGALPAPVALPQDRPRPPVQSFRGERHEYALGDRLSERLRKASTDRNCTAFTFLFTVFTQWLHRLTGQTDLVVAVPMAGQAVAGLPELVGHCVSFLPLRVRIDPTASFAAALAANRQMVLDANDHQRYTFLDLLQELELRRDASQPPLVPVSFNVDQGMEAFRFGDQRAEYRVCPRGFVKNDMFFNLIEEEHEYTLELDRNSDIYDAGTVDRWVAAFRRLLEAALDDVDAHLIGLALPELDAYPEAADEIDFDCAAEDLVSAFELAVDRFGNDVALRIDGRSFTYGELDSAANRIASTLLAEGVEPEDRVALLCERSFEAMAAIYGVLKAGSAYVPLDPELPAARVAALLDDCQPRLVLAQQRHAQQLPVGLRVIVLDAPDALWLQASTARPGRPISAATLAYVIYTSGSTGEPKGVMVEHGAVMNRVLWGQQLFELKPGERHLQKTPYSFDVSVAELFWPLQVGATLVVPKPGGHREVPYLLKLLAEEQVNVVHFVPSMLSSFLKEAAGTELPALRQVYCSGEALTGALRDRFFAVFDEVRLFNLYGPTEATVEVSAFECRSQDTGAAVPIGRAMQNCQLLVLDETLNPVAPGVEGELYLAGRQLARGYLNREAQTRDVFLTTDGIALPRRIYRTGDLARVAPNGDLWFLGRDDSQVKLRGYRVELGEIEALLQQDDAIDLAAAMVQECGEGDQRLVAYVQRSAMAADRPLNALTLRRALMDRLPQYMVPQQIVAVPELPLNGAGKLDRKALLALVEQPEATDAAVSALAPGTETMVGRIWARAIGIDAGQIMRDDNFFDLGGHSLLAMDMLRTTERVFGQRLTLKDVLYQTLAEIAELLPDRSSDELETAFAAAVAEPANESTWKSGKVMRRVLNMLNADGQ